jgi:hypothetical protein
MIWRIQESFRGFLPREVFPSDVLQGTANAGLRRSKRNGIETKYGDDRRTSAKEEELWGRAPERRGWRGRTNAATKMK